MTEWDLYWILKLDTIREVGAMFSFIFGIGLLTTTIVTIITAMVVSDLEEELGSSYQKRKLEGAKKQHKMVRWIFTILCPVFVVFLLTTALLPSTKQMAAILVVPKVANSKMIQEIPDQISILAKEWFEELRPKHEKPAPAKESE